jgi:hypothetical protein
MKAPPIEVFQAINIWNGMGGEFDYEALPFRYVLSGAKSPSEMIYLLDEIKNHLNKQREALS